MKKSITVQDTWAVWHPDDRRGRGNKIDYSKLKELYGINSAGWETLIKNIALKPEIMFIGENPSKNNEKILAGENLVIQCFHSSSPQDLLLKKVLESGFFKGSCITDAFDSAYEDEGEKITLKEIKKKYPESWNNIYVEAKGIFLKKIEQGLGEQAIICMGDDAFKYISNFIDKEVLKKDDIEPRIKHIQYQYNGHLLNIYKIDHPSPLNAKYRFLLPDELKAIEKNIL